MAKVWFVTWRWNRIPYVIDFDEKEDAYAFGMLAAECGREDVLIASREYEIDDARKERVLRRVMERIAAAGGEPDRERTESLLFRA